MKRAVLVWTTIAATAVALVIAARATTSRSKKTGGYGLGLSMCKRIMEAHGGTIVAENNAVRGATFTLPFKRRA
jgi:signal transduction histidine kinase